LYRLPGALSENECRKERTAGREFHPNGNRIEQ